MKKAISAVKGNDFSAFQAQYDKSFIVPKKIKEGLEALGDSWMTEVDFIKLAGLSTADLAKFRDQFEPHIVLTNAQHGKDKRRLWAGTTKFADKMRERIS